MPEASGPPLEPVLVGIAPTVDRDGEETPSGRRRRLLGDRPTVAKRIGRVQVESIVATATAVGGLLLGIQAITVMLGQLEHQSTLWSVLAAGGVFASFVFAGAAAVFRRARRPANATFAVVYLIALATWPLGAVVTNHVADRPWLWLLHTVATTAAAVAFPVWLASAYTVVSSLTFALVTLAESGGGSSLTTAALDTVYAMLLGFGILSLMTLLRSAGDAVDRSQAQALESYLSAVRQDAAEAERLQVDALVHDSVLTTLLSAARAGDDEQRRLVVRMAQNALGHLRVGEPADPELAEEVPLDRFAQRLAEELAQLSPAISAQFVGTATGSIPETVADALEAAALQAAVNSLQHAGADPAIERRLSVRHSAEGEVLVQFSDTGRGFDPAHVPAGRLGLRVSIGERMDAIGGELELDTAPGRGTTIRLRWQRPGRPM